MTIVPEVTMTTKPQPTLDPEAAAIGSIIATLANLTDEQRRNVLLYVNARFGSRTSAHGAAMERVASDASIGDATEPQEFATIGDLWDAASPKTEADRVLVVAYWKQVVEKAESFEAMPVNDELKHLGGDVSNITRAFDSLIGQSPKLVLQVEKRGRSKQARKRYKLTREGVRRVQAMTNAIRGEGVSNGN